MFPHFTHNKRCDLLIIQVCVMVGQNIITVTIIWVVAQVRENFSTAQISIEPVSAPELTEVSE